MFTPDASDVPPQPSDRAHAVHVRFASSQARRLQRRASIPDGDEAPLWTERPLLSERADGTFDLIATAARLDGLARWVLSHGADAEVRGPERLRKRVMAEARRVLHLYEDDVG